MQVPLQKICLLLKIGCGLYHGRLRPTMYHQQHYIGVLGGISYTFKIAMPGGNLLGTAHVCFQASTKVPAAEC